MTTTLRVAIALIVGCFAAVSTPGVARAEEFVTYEVVAQSPSLTSVNVDYADLSGPVALQNVALPWRMNAAVADPHSVDTTLHVTWQSPVRYKWVIVRIWTRGSLLCEAIADAGETTCTAKGYYKGEMPRWMPPMSPPGAS
ncbi:hypothetical protein BRW65_01105 [Mycobacterium paraffinicum]|uniref:Uncharacterized protein n=1 Tax=Mycobacterium paraffinicum TaxID=53378 RepID=A0A1Q4I270_9MYCO|nr:hypothetical protein [Mycobacterium paraffinicum]OJZ76074.1 hypothetical protein BRW65_01105 [Mycobacterium paraffinicum]